MQKKNMFKKLVDPKENIFYKHMSVKKCMY